MAKYKIVNWDIINLFEDTFYDNQHELVLDKKGYASLLCKVVKTFQELNIISEELFKGFAYKMSLLYKENEISLLQVVEMN